MRVLDPILVLTGVVLAARDGPSQVAYAFSASVSLVNPSAPGFPASLSGVTVGANVTGVLRYDAGSPSITNTSPPPLSLATRYALANASLVVTVGGVPIALSGALHAFVWNDDPISSGLSDGLLFTNVTGIGMGAQAQVGNLLLPASTWSSEALPTGNVAGPMVFTLASPGSNNSWIQATWLNLSLAPLAGYAVFGPGCPGSLGIPGNVATALPRIGQSLSVNFTNLAQNAGIVLIGWSNTMAGSIPLPFNLGPLGAPGCHVRVSADASMLVLGGSGTVTYQLAIPWSLSFLGAVLYTQCLALNPGANALGAVTSDAAAATVGV
jgi:hypothetical protein